MPRGRSSNGAISRELILTANDPFEGRRATGCLTSYWNLSRQRLAETGFRVVNSGNGFETIELSSSGQVDVLVWDLDHNHAEVTLITNEIRQLRPQFPTIVLTEGAAPDTLRALADTLIPKGNDEVLVASLEKIL